MRNYEVLVIFKPILDVEAVEQAIANFQKNLVEANQGEIVETDKIGRKRLAYEIRKFKDGFLALFLIKFPPANVAAFKRGCQIQDDILRLTMVAQDTMPTRSTLHDDIPEKREDMGRRRFAPRR